MIVWEFFELNETGFYENGDVIANGGSYDKMDDSLPYAYSMFPLTFNTHWTGTTLEAGTISGYATTSKLTYDNTVDGYGTIITPEGSFQCLRLREKYNTTVTALGNTSTSTDYYYLFFDKNKYYAQIYADSNDVPVSLIYYTTSITTGIEEPSGKSPADFTLYQNYPNPFNPSTTIRFDLKKSSAVALEIFNVLGQRVLEQKYGMMDAGQYSTVVAMASLSSGVYYYRIMAQGTDGQRFVSVKKLVLMK